MQWVSALSRQTNFNDAVHQACEQLSEGLAGEPLSLVLVFASPHHAHSFDHLSGLISEELDPGLIAGCSGAGVIGGGHEVEGAPAIALLGASLPEVTLTGFHLSPQEIPGTQAEPWEWEEAIGVTAEHDPAFVLLADPFTVDAPALLQGLDAAFPAAVKVGGLSSGGQLPSTHALFLGDERKSSGLVGVALSGNIHVETVVAQGCRPIGSPMFVTACDRNIIYSLDGGAPVDALTQLFQTLEPADQALFRNDLMLGLVMQADRDHYGSGDYLIRNIMGVEPDSGSLAVAAQLATRQVVQFHLRDKQAASDELFTLLTEYRERSPTEPPSGAILFSCAGRGAGLFGQPDHDSGLFRTILGAAPLGGFFCSGEIGPIQHTTHLHGYTSAFAVIRPRWS